MADGSPGAKSRNNQGNKHPGLGRKPLRTLLRIGAALGSVWIVGAGLTTLWPMDDKVAPALPSANKASSLAPYPHHPVTVLVVGIDANGIGDPINQAAPTGPANADSLMLIRVEAFQPLQILQIPTELGVNLPGIQTMQPLANSYRQGGVALIADVVADVVGLPEDEPSRYVVMPRRALRGIINGLGNVNVQLAQPLTHQDTGQNYSVNLEAGRQILNGAQAEQLARFRPDPLNNHGRRLRQQGLIQAIHEQLQQPNITLLLPRLIGELSSDVDTNMSEQEWFSLVAAALSSNQPPLVSTLPLAPRAGQQPLRQLKTGTAMPLWPPLN
ncbi:MAG: LCP family protein [Synechococcus sp.]